jgi:RNA polymerase sigma factor (sigma-70 family)
MVQPLNRLVERARNGDLDAFADVVRATQQMAFALAFGVLRDPALAQDAVQEAYLTGFRRLAGLNDPAAFLSWFRRIVINAAVDARRSRRRTFVQLEDVPDVPVLDESETRWTEGQRQRLAQALLVLTADERRICDRRYHGGWSTPRLAATAGIDEAAMRKRLQRIRDRLRKEIEMVERREINSSQMPRDLPGKIAELLSRPQLTELPDNPVGQVLKLLRDVYANFSDRELPEVVDWAAAERSIGRDALYVDAAELHRIDDARILRYDLTLPLLMQVRYEGTPLRIFATGKAYRVCQPDTMHLEAFHQAEVFCVDERARLDKWNVMALVLRSVEATMPGLPVRMMPTAYPMCSQAWDVDVEWNGRWWEVLAFGVFTDRVVSHLGADPAVHTAIGAGYGLERLAMLRYRIDDIRKLDVASVA